MSRKLMGKTFGNEAEPGTIRGDFGAAGALTLSTDPTARNQPLMKSASTFAPTN